MYVDRLVKVGVVCECLCMCVCVCVCVCHHTHLYTVPTDTMKRFGVQ